MEIALDSHLLSVAVLPDVLNAQFHTGSRAMGISFLGVTLAIASGFLPIVDESSGVIAIAKEGYPFKGDVSKSVVRKRIFASGHDDTREINRVSGGGRTQRVVRNKRVCRASQIRASSVGLPDVHSPRRFLIRNRWFY